MAIGFIASNLIAMGPADQVRKALDAPESTNVSANADLMRLIHDSSTANAWVVGHFDAVTRRMGLPKRMDSEVPPLKLVSAAAHINGGVKAVVKAETNDDAAAEQFRNLIRSAIAFVKLQASARPEMQDALKTVELTGSGTKVQLSFTITPETLKSLASTVERDRNQR